jgi:gliding motility-associated-like protein
MMSRPSWIFLISFCISGIYNFAQGNNNCSSASILCSNQPQSGNNFGATVEICDGCADGSSADGNFCFELDNTVWYSFITNSLGGSAVLTLSNLQCIVGNGIGNGLQAIIIQAGTPCNENTYSAVSNCETGSSSDFSLTANNLTPNTTYYIQLDGINDVNGAAECSFSIFLSGEAVDFIIDAGEDQLIIEGESTLLEGSGPSGSVWTPSTGLSDASIASPIATPTISSTYFYTFTALNGCVYADDVRINFDRPIIIMNTLTPNDDGINDLWEIRDANKYPGIKVNVYDRWGQRVFNSIGYGGDKKWDGTYLGSIVPAGVYYYVIELGTGQKGHTFSGYVTVIR